jgi:predicted permease
MARCSQFQTMQWLPQHFRSCVRLIKQSPGFAAVTVLTLALGIGANTAIFSILDALMLRNLPVWRPDRLVQVAAIYRNGATVPVSFPAFQQLQQNQRVFSDLFGWTPGSNRNLEVDGELFPASVRGVTGNYYGALGASPLVGRLIAPEDAANSPGAPVAVVGYEFWNRRLGRNPAVVGKTIRIENTSFTIVGVSRKWFMGMTPGSPPDITVPITAGPFAQQTSERALLWIFVAGRLKDRFTIDQAQQQLRSFWRDVLLSTAPTTAPGPRLQSWLAIGLEVNSAATGISPDLREHLEGPLKALMGLAVLILLVACINLANLTLARVTARSREISVRVALGATRFEVVRQLLAETILLSGAGAAIATILANWGGHLLLTMIGTGQPVPVLLDLRPDWRIFGFTALAAMGTGVLIACAPAWQMARHDPADILRADERTLAGGSGRLTKFLLVIQLGFSLVLVFGAGLLLQTFQTLRSSDPHFQRKSVVQVALNPRPEGFDKVDMNDYRKQLIDAVTSLPGVASASFAGLDIPSGDRGWRDTVSTATADSPSDAGKLAMLVMVSPGFFQTLGIPILSGRDFAWTDDQNHPRVTIVDSNLARQLRTSSDVLGTRVRFGVRPELQDLTVVGVAGNANLINPRDAGAMVIYVPSPQYEDGSIAGNLFVRSENPAAITRMVQNEIQSLHHEYSISAKTLEETTDQVLVEDRATAILSTLFAGLALILAGIGLFGLMSYAVTKRTREIGIRIAVGARPEVILGLILRESVLLCAVSILVGVPCAIAARQFIAHLLFGVASTDPLTFVVAGAILLAVGALAGYWPARRATRIDPMAALRRE